MEILEILSKIPPADCDYQEWLAVGMALKEEGYSAADWDMLAEKGYTLKDTPQGVQIIRNN